MINSWKKNKFLSGFSNHFRSEVNATLPYFPPLIYIVSKMNNSKNILEVGIEGAYSTYYLASVAKENNGMYYGIDINKQACDLAREKLNKENIPNKIFCLDTKEIKDLKNIGIEKIDIAFLDGEHTTEAVMNEVELIYPILSDDGWGYIFIHDIVDMGNAGAWLKLKKDDRFETLGFNPNYGLGIARKMKGVNYEEIAKKYEQSIYFKRRWNVLIDLIKENDYKKIAEIGVDQGETTKALLGCCDIWKYVLVDNKFKKHLKNELNHKSVEIVEMDSVDAAKKYKNGEFDLIFIDAGHQYKDVKDDIEAWLPKVRKGGIISGHDYFKSGDKPYSQVTSAVNEKFDKVELISDESPHSDRCVWYKYVD